MSFRTPIENPGMRPPRPRAFGIGCALLATVTSRMSFSAVLSCAKADAGDAADELAEPSYVETGPSPVNQPPRH
jgi:hypothetical protein